MHLLCRSIELFLHHLYFNIKNYHSLILNIIDCECQLLPKHSAAIILSQRHRVKEKKDKKYVEPEKPGKESERKNRENFTRQAHFTYKIKCLIIILRV